MTRAPLEIVIAGGGIGGLTLGIALHQAGFKPVIYERASEHREIGAAITLFANATHVLRALGLLDRLVEDSSIVRGGWARAVDGTRLTRIEVTSALPVPAISLLRPDLQSTLVAAFPRAALHLGDGVHGFEQAGDCVIVELDSGTRVECDALVGCDGVRSVVRRQQLGDGGPTYAGYTSWRGQTTLAGRVLPEGDAGETIGAGIRAGIWPVGHGLTSWWVGTEEPEGTSDEPEGRKNKLLRLCQGWHPPIEELISGCDHILKADLYHRKPARGWSKGRVTLLGDAAHPMTPDIGQGGCMAIEDAMVLSRCLEKYGNVEAALTRYEEVRFGRTRNIVMQARAQGIVGLWKNPALVAIRAFAFKRFAFLLQARAASSIFDYDATRVAV